MIKLFGLHFILGCLCSAIMAQTILPELFFPNINGNLSRITWAHAVNNQSVLDETLNSTIMMIEADVVLGQVNGTDTTIPIMGHPPENTSDLSLQTFLTTIHNFNQNNNSSKKGVKLDFKSTEVFQSSITIINNLYSQIDYPLWINADIIEGPLNANTTPVDANTFFSSCKIFDKSILSVGWTTRYGLTENITNASYTDTQISNMLQSIQNNNVSQDLTFPVRAGIAAESPSQLADLVANVTNSTLTIWSASGDSVDVDKLRDLILGIGLGRVYVDVPEELESLLDLSGSNHLTSFLLFTVILSLFSVLF